LKIELLKEQLMISEIEPQHIRKLRTMLDIWGFKEVDNSHFSTTPDMKETLQKTLNYCQTNDIIFSLSEQLKTSVEQYNEVDQAFDKKREECRLYKDGKIDNEKIEELKTFLYNDLKRPPRDHQVKAACHLYLAGNGANFSVPGSGKTSVVISVYEKLRLEGRVNTLIIIGPTTCFESWETEFPKTIGRKPGSVILAGGDKDKRKSKYNIHDRSKRPELFITSFQTLMNDQDDIVKMLQNPDVKSFVVVDEAHYIKRLNGRWSNAAMKLANDSNYRCVLTGTPLPRAYSDFYNLFEFLWPDNSPISRQTKLLIETIDSNDTDLNVHAAFEREIGPFHFRVRKSDLRLAKQNFYEPILVEQNPIEKEIYEAIVNRITTLSKGDFLNEIGLIDKLRRGRVMRLRQAASYSKLLRTALYEDDDTEFEPLSFKDSKIGEMIRDYDQIETPNKINKLLKIVKNLNSRGEKVIIWSSFINTIKLISKHLHKEGIHNEKIYGEIPFLDHPYKEIKSRTKIKNIFLDPDSGLDVIIANPAAFAESVSLHTTCSHAIYYDLSYNCAQFLQSLDRIHRVGGSEDKEAHYYFLQYANTIDQDIQELIMERRDRMSALIDQDYEIFSLDMFEDDNEEILAYERVFNKTE
jgi:SNF2 family DNA or RNA helicase